MAEEEFPRRWPLRAVSSPTAKETKSDLGGILAALVLVCLGMGSPVWAEEEEEPLQEVFASELVYPQEKGEFQLTLSPLWGSGPEEDQLESRLVFEYGITDALQVELEWNVYNWRDPEDGARSEGIGDLEIGMKYAWMNLGEDFHVAVGLEISFPTGDLEDEFTEGFVEYEPFVVIARDFPDFHDLQLFAQLGLGLVQRARTIEDEDEEEPAAHELAVSVGFFVPFESVVPTFEISWSTNTWNHDGEENELYVTSGLVWGLSDDWEAGLGLAFGLTDDADDHRLIAMLTAEF